jgi:hypothetical protein
MQQIYWEIFFVGVLHFGNWEAHITKNEVKLKNSVI